MEFNNTYTLAVKRELIDPGFTFEFHVREDGRDSGKKVKYSMKKHSRRNPPLKAFDVSITGRYCSSLLL